MAPTILVADDQASTRTHLAGRLVDAGFEVVEARDGLDAWEQFCEHAPDLILTDLRMPRCGGLELLERVRTCSSIPVIILTAFGDVPTAVRAVKGGAEEFLSFDGLDVDQLVERIRRLVHTRSTPGVAEALARHISGESPAIRRTRARIEALLDVRLPVLIVGEPGSGRSQVARAMHELGPEPDGEFRHVLCSEDPAPSDWPERGTVYLQDAHLLSLANRRLWLAFSERYARGEPLARSISSSVPLPTDALQAYLGPLRSEIAERTARLRVYLPRLVDRLNDLPLLCSQLVESLAEKLQRPRIDFEPAALARLRAHSWPGNLRELSDVIEQLVTFSPRARVGESAVEDALRQAHPEVADFREDRHRKQHAELVDALRDTGGNLTRAADMLGISRGALRHRARKYGLLPSRRDGR
jgi:two-component system response regulator GlrR